MAAAGAAASTAVAGVGSECLASTAVAGVESECLQRVLLALQAVLRVRAPLEAGSFHALRTPLSGA